MKKKGMFSQGDRPVAKLNITSLMDALTIILIFLLVNYSDQPEERELPKFVSLPKITGDIDTQKTNPMLVSIGPKQLTIGKDFSIEYQDIEKEIESINSKVSAYLESVSKKPDSNAQLEKGAENIAKKVTVNADKKIRFEVLSQLIATLSDNGFGSIDFINLSEKD
jgi:biopolymer transport protein ExbD